MRRVAPGTCNDTLSEVLTKYQVETDLAPGDVDNIWKRFSGVNSFDLLRQALYEPLGEKRRCAYCSDSRAADVEHFWPKKKYPNRAFTFDNLLFVCPECNRKKNQTFPLDNAGQALLINPMFDDPWDSLYFVPKTGYIGARVLSLGQDKTVHLDPRGEKTIKVFGLILNSDPIITGRKENWHQVVEIIGNLLVDTGPIPSSWSAIFARRDQFGLSEFIMNREGKNDPAVRALITSNPSRWLAIKELPRQ